MTTTPDWSTAPAWLLPNGSVMDAETITAWAKFTAGDHGIEFDPEACQPLRTSKGWADGIDTAAVGEALIDVIAPFFSDAERADGDHREVAILAAEDAAHYLKENR